MSVGLPMRHHHALALAALVARCTTLYRASTSAGGYTEKRIGPNTVEIGLGGRGLTRESTTATYAMLRACEIAVERGYTHVYVAASAGTAHWKSEPTGAALALPGGVPAASGASRDTRSSLRAVRLTSDEATSSEWAERYARAYLSAHASPEALQRVEALDASRTTGSPP